MQINFFGLDVSKTNQICLLYWIGHLMVITWFQNCPIIVPQYVSTPTPNSPLHGMHGYLIDPQS